MLSHEIKISAGILKEDGKFNVWIAPIDDWPIMNNGFCLASCGVEEEALQVIRNMDYNVRYYGVVDDIKNFDSTVSLPRIGK